MDIYRYFIKYCKPILYLATKGKANAAHSELLLCSGAWEWCLGVVPRSGGTYYVMV